MPVLRKYGGKIESLGKERCRMRGYELCGRALWDTYHIVIASRDCGDIIALRGKNVNPNKIIACDTDEHALFCVQQMHRGVIISPHPTIRDTVRWAISQGYKIGSINVDLCESLVTTMPVFEGVWNVVQEAGIKVVLMFTFLRGRDATIVRDCVDTDKARENHVIHHVGVTPTFMDGYNSYTSAKQGSNMAVYAWEVAGRRGPKRVMEAPESAQENIDTKEKWRQAGLKAWATRRANLAK